MNGEVFNNTFKLIGYCFSAALPPLLATAAKHAIDIMDEEPSIFDTLHANCQTIHDAFSNIYGLELHADRISPIKHLRMLKTFCSSYCNNNRHKTKKIMQQIVDEVIMRFIHTFYGKHLLSKLKLRNYSI